MTTTETKIDTGTDELLCAIRDRVAVITLNRPEVRNALSDRLTPALRTMIKTCGENPDVGALLITGAGTAFCSGGDVKGMGAHRDPKRLAMSYDEKVADLQERQRLLTGALVSVRKPTIAALPGAAAGAGLAIAMACDIRIAAESAFKRLKRSELTGSAARGEESFACQSTPSVQLPRTSGFQFAYTTCRHRLPTYPHLTIPRKLLWENSCMDSLGRFSPASHPTI